MVISGEPAYWRLLDLGVCSTSFRRLLDLAEHAGLRWCWGARLSLLINDIRWKWCTVSCIYIMNKDVIT